MFGGHEHSDISSELKIDGFKSYHIGQATVHDNLEA
jgi:hypothetical protein